MPHFAKPAEGSWTEHYPRARHRARLLRGLDLARALRARARGDLPADVAERRPGRAAPADGQLLHQGARRRRHVGRSSCAAPTARSAPSTTSAATAATSSCGRTTRARRRAAPAGSSPASTTAGATTSRATLTFVQQEAEFFDLDKADYGLAPVRCEVWEGFIFVNLDPDDTDAAARLPRRARRGPRGLPVRRDDPGLQVPRRGREQLEALHRRLHRVLPRTCSAREAGGGRRVAQAAGLRLRGARLRASTARTAWCRRGAACRRRRTSSMVKPIERVLRSGLFGPWDAPDIGLDELPPAVNPARHQRVGHRLVPVLPQLHAADLEAELVPHVPLLADVATTRTSSRARCYFVPPKNARERLQQELAVGDVQGVRAPGRQHARGHADDARVRAR